MAHNFLNDLQIGFVLAESGAEGMTEIVNTEMREQLRFSVFLFCLCSFFFVVVSENTINGTINHVRVKASSVSILEDESAKSINYCLVEAFLFLPFPLRQQCSLNL